MSRTSKSPRAVTLAAYVAAKNSLPNYAHRFSPHKFTQPQLMACLVLKTFTNTDYRGVWQLLRDCPEFAADIGMQSVPHWTTLQKASRRLLRMQLFRDMLDVTVDMALKRRRVAHLAAVDSTGYESRHTSRYYVRRRGKTDKAWESTTYRRFPKLTLIIETASHVILAAMATRGPSPDVNQLTPILDASSRRATIETIVGDAGYDSEPNHCYARLEHGIRTLFPAKHGRPGRDPPTGYYRRLMTRRFDRRKYGQRWQIETVNSMMKRNMGCELAARSYQSQRREMLVMVLTHNLAIFLLVIWGFLQSSRHMFSLIGISGAGDAISLQVHANAICRLRQGREPANAVSRKRLTLQMSLQMQAHGSAVDNASTTRLHAVSIPCTPVRFSSQKSPPESWRAFYVWEHRVYILASFLLKKNENRRF